MQAQAASMAPTLLLLQCSLITRQHWHNLAALYSSIPSSPLFMCSGSNNICSRTEELQ